jgi:hypothetical protein
MWVKWGLILRQLKEKRNFRKRVKTEEKAGYFLYFSSAKPVQRTIIPHAPSKQPHN